MVAYIDDILVLAESKELAKSHVDAVVYLFQWFPDKPKEVSAGASTDNGIPGSDSRYCGYCDHGIETSSRKGEKDSCGVTSYGMSQVGPSSSPGTACGVNISGDPTSPTIFPQLTDGTVRHIKQKLPVLRGTG